MLHELNESDYIWLLNFCAWLCDNCPSLTDILRSDKADLHLNDDISSNFCRIWTMEKPKYYLTKLVHPQSLCVWFRFTTLFKLQPIFLIRQLMETITFRCFKIPESRSLKFKFSCKNYHWPFVRYTVLQLTMPQSFKFIFIWLFKRTNNLSGFWHFMVSLFARS